MWPVCLAAYVLPQLSSPCRDGIDEQFKSSPEGSSEASDTAFAHGGLGHYCALLKGAEGKVIRIKWLPRRPRSGSSLATPASACCSSLASLVVSLACGWWLPAPIKSSCQHLPSYTEPPPTQRGVNLPPPTAPAISPPPCIFPMHTPSLTRSCPKSVQLFYWHRCPPWRGRRGN